MDFCIFHQQSANDHFMRVVAHVIPIAQLFDSDCKIIYSMGLPQILILRNEFNQAELHSEQRAVAHMVTIAQLFDSDCLRWHSLKILTMRNGTPL